MRSDVAGRVAASLTLGVALALSSTSALRAQDPEEVRRQLEESQTRLDQIRVERSALQTQLGDLTSQVHDVAEEIRNIERQIAVSASAMVELDVQIGALLDQVTIMTRDMLLNRDRLTARKAVLGERLRDDVEAIVAGATITRERVVGDAQEYVHRLRRHMAWEEEDLFPRADAQGDDLEIDTSHLDAADPVFGVVRETSFANLLQTIEREAQ